MSIGVWDTTAESSSVREYQIKAAFLYNFAKFVEWPAGLFVDDNSPIILCVIGYDPFGEALDVMREKTIGRRNILIKRVMDIEDLEECHILFISSSERRNLSQILRIIRNKSVLTVGDTKGFACSGVIINIASEENRLGFEINVDAAQRAHLKLSSKILKLGKIVKEDG
jgi:hypothetical protein